MCGVFDGVITFYPYLSLSSNPFFVYIYIYIWFAPFYFLEYHSIFGWFSKEILLKTGQSY